MQSGTAREGATALRFGCDPARTIRRRSQWPDEVCVWPRMPGTLFIVDTARGRAAMAIARERQARRAMSFR